MISRGQSLGDLQTSQSPARNAAAGLTQASFLQQLCGLPGLDPSLGSALFSLVAGEKESANHTDVLVFKARLERQDEDTRLRCCYSILAHPTSGPIALPALQARIAAVAQLALSPPAPRTKAAAGASHPAAAASAADTGSANPESQTPEPEETETAAAAAAAASGSGPDTPPDHTPALDQLAQAMAHGAMLCVQGDSPSDNTSSSSPCLDEESYVRWCKACPAVQLVLSRLMSGVGRLASAAGTSVAAAAAAAAAAAPAHPQSVGASPVTAADSDGPVGSPHFLSLPTLVGTSGYNLSSLLLQPPLIWLLSSCLSRDLCQEWRPLFNSERDGKSFNTFLGRAQASPGPTLLLVKDAAGHLFGGFAPLPWVKSGAFYGEFTTFIFRIEPVAQVFRATGINSNFQWCGIGFKALPSGIGFGGAQAKDALGQFALYVDSTLDSGMSRPIATFGNVPLSGEQKFQVSSVELWLLKPPEEEDLPPDRKAGPGSVLDRHVEDKAILAAVGYSMHSEGLRRPGGPRPEDDL
ncbi:MAG: hypothetical protein WDW36_007787 [Sanguina aurantia]